MFTAENGLTIEITEEESAAFDHWLIENEARIAPILDKAEKMLYCFRKLLVMSQG